MKGISLLLFKTNKRKRGEKKNDILKTDCQPLLEPPLRSEMKAVTAVSVVLGEIKQTAP